MKFICLLLIVCCLFSKTEAQKDSLNQRFFENKIGRHIISLPRKYDLPVAELKVSGFEVVDLRPDTSRLGFWDGEAARKQLVFPTSTGKAISSWLNKMYAIPGNSRSMLIIIKKLWLYDNKYVGKPRDPMWQDSKGRIEFRLEAFLKTNEGLVPFTYLDTVALSTISVRTAAGFRIPLLLLRLMDKIATTDETAVMSRKSFYSLQQLDSMNKKKYLSPIDTATVLNKGVYASVSDFRNNQPSILDYEIQKDANSNLMLFLKDETGKSYFSRKMWGYCDGQYSYVMMDGNLFPILPVNHSFYIWGSNQFRETGAALPLILPLVPGGVIALEQINPNSKRRMRVFSLDINSGEIY